MSIRLKTSKKKRNTPQIPSVRQSAPVAIKKIYLERAIESIRKKKDVKRRHHSKMFQEYGVKAEKALSECLQPSAEKLLSYTPLYIFSCSTSTLLYQLRKALLSRNWPHFLELLQILVRSNQINRRFLIYVIRSSLILLLNHSKDVNAIDEFISICLGIRDDYRKNDFLDSIFTIPVRLKLGNVLENQRKRATQV